VATEAWDWASLAGARVVDLAHGLRRGIPVSPNHPPFQFALQRRHGDMMRSDGGSAANELFVMGGHVGTHVDALAHVSQDGLLHGGVDATEVTTNDGFRVHGIDQLPPFVGRAVLLDVAATRGLKVLDPGEPVTADDLQAAEDRAGVRLRPGDAALIRTGWAAHWEDPPRFVGLADGTPGPDESAARWLVERGVRLAAAETVAFEVIHAGAGHATLPVHRILLVEAGIPIGEMFDLTELAGAGAGECLLVVAPLKIVGGTGGPARPLAILPAAGTA
jgi:kynurenine formamidase